MRSSKNDREDAMTMKSDSNKHTPEAHLRSSVERLDPKTQKLMRSVRAALRRRFPTHNELAYDYATSFVISYSPTEGGIDGILAIAGRADGVRLYLQGVQLPDPKGLLLGSGKQARFAAAIAQARAPVPSKGRGALIIKSAGVKQRRRRQPTK
jgi:hypothetical protein